MGARLGGLVLEAHGGADVGVDGVGAGDGLDGVGVEGDGASGLLGDLDGLVDDLELGGEGLGGGDGQWAPSCAAVSMSEWQTLLPSPT